MKLDIISIFLNLQRFVLWPSRASLGEGNGNPLQCSCLENPRNRGAWCAAIYGVAQSRTWLRWLSSSSSRSSLVAQLVKNLPAMQETWVQFLGWKDPLEKGKATHSSILAWRIPCVVHGVTVRHDWLTFTLKTSCGFPGGACGKKPVCQCRRL